MREHSRDALLDTKRTELQNCVNRRKRKLREFRFATVYLDPTQADKYGEAEFLDANDITKGKFFDENAFYNKFSTHPAIGIHKDATPHSPDRGLDVRSEDGKRYGAVDSAVQTTNVSNQTTVTLEKTPAKGVKGQPASRDIDPDAMEGIMASTVGEIGSKQSNTDGYGLSSGVQPVTGTSTQVIPPGAHDILTKGTKYVDGSEGPGSTMKDDVIPAHPSLGSQTATESDSLLTATTTPDAQLQLEAAQFMSTRPLLPPNTRTPLHPSNGSKEKRDVATRTEEPSSKQQEEGHGGHLEDLQPLAQRERAPPEAKVVSAPAPTYMPKGVAKNPTHEQKQPIRIDTGVSQNRAPGDTPTPSTTSTPLRSAYTAMQSSPPERMTTRVSSGALRHKSVSEILGETPKPGSHHGDRTPGEKVDSGREDNLPRHANLVTSPDSVSFRPRVNSTKEREKDRSKLHTVVFAAPKTKDLTRLPESRSGESSRRTRDSEDKDYLVTLFAAQASAQNPTLNHLINSAQKTLTTDNHYIDYHESQDCRILKRIYHLQNSNRWSLRQFERGAEPDRTATHWDVLLGEMRWMRTDFREERKWKLATAKNLADWCAEWVATTPGRRVFLQVKVQKPGSRLHQLDSHVTPVSLYNTGGSVRSDTTPELIPSAEDDMSDAADEEILHVDVSAGSAPAALFSLAPDDVVFNLDKTPISDKVLSELPLYQPFVDSQYLGRSMDKTLDRAWKKPIVPVSKFAIGKMVIKEEGPIRKRSRYNYQDEDENSPESASSLHPSEQSTAVAAPEKDDVALFNPDYRHIIHRLHAAHAFRPPSEFSMPSQSFFESRQPSQWTLSEDDELRRLVREYEYNWSLISGCVASQSSFSSNAERRTPWECFERWVSFEGLPGDMARHQYFRAWNARRDAARQRLESLYLHQQQAGAGAQAIRRRSGEPAGVERRRNNKHLALVHAMSKVAKKKETILQKRQHEASLAAMRKAAEPSQSRSRMRTPREFSAHKHKQESEYKEKQLLYRQQLAANQRAVLAQKAAQQAGQPQGGPGGLPPSRNGVPGPINGATGHMVANSLGHGIPGGPRPMPSTQGALNGVLPNGVPAHNGQNGLRSVPQAQMQSYVPGQQRLATQNGQDRVIMEATRLSEQQRAMAQQQHYHQTNGINGTPSGALGRDGNMQIPPNSNFPSGMRGGSVKIGPVSNGVPGVVRTTSSPGMASATQAHQLSNGMVPLLNQITNHLKATNPNASHEQIKQMATMQLNNHLRNQNSQAAANLGVNGGMAMLPGQHALGFSSGQINPQVYAQMMRNQQASQQSRNTNGDVNGARPSSQGSVQAKRNSNGSSVGAPNASQSPRPPQAQLAGQS